MEEMIGNMAFGLRLSEIRNRIDYIPIEDILQSRLSPLLVFQMMCEKVTGDLFHSQVKTAFTPNSVWTVMVRHQIRYNRNMPPIFIENSMDEDKLVNYILLGQEGDQSYPYVILESTLYGYKHS